MAFSLPFDFNNASISSWLSQLNSTDVVSVGHEVFKVVNILKKEVDDVNRESLELIVERLTPVVIHTSGFLEKVFFGKSDNLTGQQRKIAQLNTLLLRYLAFLHVYLAEHTTDLENKNLHANYGVQLIGFALYSSALSYEKPAFSLWNMAGDIYKTALTDDILEDTIKKPLAVFDKLPTINSVLKRNLLFSIGINYNFNHQQIKYYFDFCSLHRELVVLDRLSIKNSPGYCWEYASGQKPFPVTSKSDDQSISKLEIAATGIVMQPKLYFNVEPLLSAFDHSVVDVPFDESVGFVEHLSNYQAINESNFSLPRHYVFLFGFDQIIEYLSRLVRENSLSTFKAPSVDELNFSSLDLMPTQQKKSHKIDDISDIWGDDKSELENIELMFGPQKTYQTKLSGFLSVEWMKVEASFNGLILMYGKDMKSSIAVVRRLEKGGGGSNVKNGVINVQKGVIEVLKGSVSVVDLINGVEQRKAVLLTQDDTYEMILAVDRYVTGSVLKLKQGEAVLDRMLEFTPFFVRYAVSLKN